MSILDPLSKEYYRWKQEADDLSNIINLITNAIRGDNEFSVDSENMDETGVNEG